MCHKFNSLYFNLVDTLEKDSIVDTCSDIRDTLEKLVEKWTYSLDRQDIPVPMDVPDYHDGIDNAIQSIDALRGIYQLFCYIYI